MQNLTLKISKIQNLKYSVFFRLRAITGLNATHFHMQTGIEMQIWQKHSSGTF